MTRNRNSNQRQPGTPLEEYLNKKGLSAMASTRVPMPRALLWSGLHIAREKGMTLQQFMAMLLEFEVRSADPHLMEGKTIQHETRRAEMTQAFEAEQSTLAYLTNNDNTQRDIRDNNETQSN